MEPNRRVWPVIEGGTFFKPWWAWAFFCPRCAFDSSGCIVLVLMSIGATVVDLCQLSNGIIGGLLHKLNWSAIERFCCYRICWANSKCRLGGGGGGALSKQVDSFMQMLYSREPKERTPSVFYPLLSQDTVEVRFSTYLSLSFSFFFWWPTKWFNWFVLVFDRLFLH